MKPLISLKDHNQSIPFSKEEPYPRDNGIACPKCGTETQDTGPSVLASLPTQKEIRCPACHYVAYRLA